MGMTGCDFRCHIIALCTVAKINIVPVLSREEFHFTSKFLCGVLYIHC